MKKRALIAFSIMLSITSCILQSPKYTTIDKVISLQLGMTKAQVEDTLGVQPYDIKSYTDSSKTFIYIYRVTDRRTFTINTKPVNGKKVIGKYVQLDITYSKDGKVISIETCRYCPDILLTKSKVDIGKIVIFVTVTMPVILIYLGLKK